jgi:hypothetical protein
MLSLADSTHDRSRDEAFKAATSGNPHYGNRSPQEAS